MKNTNFKLGLALSFLALNSCQFGPKLKIPEVNYSSQWQDKSEFVNNEILVDRWWEIFKDEKLNELVELAAVNNFDIQIALANIEKARAEKNIARSDFFPDVSYNVDGAKSYDGSNSAGNKKSKDFSAGFDAIWELDLWGGIRKRSSAARDRYFAQIENKRAMTLSVVAEVVQNYMALRGYQEQLAITRENMELLDQTIRLIQIQKNVGVATNFDLSRAQSQKEIVEAAEPNIQANIQVAIHRLSILIGKDPNFLTENLKMAQDLPQNLDIVPVGVPSTVLRRRPDIKEAEYLLAAENSEIGAAIADFFPSFSLTGSIGNNTTKFSNLFDSASNNWSYGGLINLPFFRGGELLSQYKQSKAETQAAMLTYEKTVMAALGEVESSLVKYAQEIETNKRLELAAKNGEKVVDLANQRYEAGYDDLLAVIDAKRSLIAIKNSLVTSDINVLTDVIALYKALGGGFEIGENKDEAVSKATAKAISDKIENEKAAAKNVESKTTAKEEVKSNQESAKETVTEPKEEIKESKKPTVKDSLKPSISPKKKFNLKKPDPEME